jgi:CP family cyanate transporter-like MFS transporter
LATHFGQQVTARPTTRGAAPTQIAALLLVALALRPQIAAIGPLVPGIRDELGASHFFLGLLTAIPVLCMGLFALAGPAVARRFGAREAIALSVAAIVAFALARALLPGPVPLLLLTVGIGVGTGIVGPILSMFVRSRLAERLVGGTAAYAGGTLLGATLATATAVPLAAAFGGWRNALSILAVASVGSIVAWLVLVPRRRAHGSGNAGQGPAAMAATEADVTGVAAAGISTAPQGNLRAAARRPVVWAIGLLFGLQSWLYYGTTAWLASVYLERGRSATDAGLLVAIVSLAGLASILIAPFASRAVGSRRILLGAAASASTVGLLGIAAVPEPALVWAMSLGLGLGMMFTLGLTLPIDVGSDAAEVGGAAAMMLLVGYLLAAVAPTVLGAVRDATGTFETAVWLLVVIAAAMIPLGLSLTPAVLRPAGRRS